MELTQLLKEVEKNVSKAELGKAITKLIDYFFNRNDLDFEEIKGDLLLISAQYSYFEKHILKGTSSEDEKYLRFNKINDQFLSVLQSIKNILKDKSNSNKASNFVSNEEFVSIELTLNKNINEFSIIEQRLLFDKIRTVLALGSSLRIKNLAIGSIIITIEIPKQEVEKLNFFFEKGELQEFAVTEIKVKELNPKSKLFLAGFRTGFYRYRPFFEGIDNLITPINIIIIILMIASLIFVFTLDASNVYLLVYLIVLVLLIVVKVEKVFTKK